MTSSIWNLCVQKLESELSDQLLNTWIRPLQAEQKEQVLYLYAPNRFVLDWVTDHYLERINQLVTAYGLESNTTMVSLQVGSRVNVTAPHGSKPNSSESQSTDREYSHNLNPVSYTHLTLPTTLNV